MEFKIEMLINRLEKEVEIVGRLAEEARDEMQAYRNEGRESMADQCYATARYYEGIESGKESVLADLKRMFG